MNRIVEISNPTRLIAERDHNDGSYVLLGKTTRTLVSFLLLALLPYLLPGLGRLRILPASTVFGTSAKESGRESVSQAANLKLDTGVAATEVETTPGEVEDLSGHALENFFKALHSTETTEAQTRVCHYGDSPITNDGITSTVRRKLQLRFGDAGHGFVLAARPWAWYQHAGVYHEAAGSWNIDPMFISKGDHLFGLGGASFTADSTSASASFGTAEDGEVGRLVSTFDTYFLVQPGGGDFEIDIDGVPQARVSTNGESVKSSFHEVRVPKGSHRMTLKPAGNGEVRIFGVALETDGRGVQYDSLGVNGAFIGLLAHYIDEQHWAEQLRHRRPDLVVIGYGANESQFERLPMDQYEKDTREVIRRIRSALPDVSILFVGPMDRGERGAGGKVVTRPMIKKLIASQRRIAAENECAFFDTFTAMGGEGTVAKWREARPRLMGGDFTHPTAQGSEIVGTLIYDAMMRAYEQYKERRQH
ncbi:MAG TPA: GDSL-type esterase/lipase family protein [Blastocatellia bacterium]|jgi:lysophospholipase L1-like esterase|nr:GDSL-type esterase/lipase family protein [Blastocatellia bacterium]